MTKTIEVNVPQKGTKAWKWIQKTYQFKEGLKEKLSLVLNEPSAELMAKELYEYWLEHFEWDPNCAYDPERDYS